MPRRGMILAPPDGDPILALTAAIVGFVLLNVAVPATRDAGVPDLDAPLEWHLEPFAQSSMGRDDIRHTFPGHLAGDASLWRYCTHGQHSREAERDAKGRHRPTGHPHPLARP